MKISNAINLYSTKDSTKIEQNVDETKRNPKRQSQSKTSLKNDANIIKTALLKEAEIAKLEINLRDFDMPFNEAKRILAKIEDNIDKRLNNKLYKDFMFKKDTLNKLQTLENMPLPSATAYNNAMQNLLLESEKILQDAYLKDKDTFEILLNFKANIIANSDSIQSQKQDLEHSLKEAQNNSDTSEFLNKLIGANKESYIKFGIKGDYASTNANLADSLESFFVFAKLQGFLSEEKARYLQSDINTAQRYLYNQSLDLDNSLTINNLTISWDKDGIFYKNFNISYAETARLKLNLQDDILQFFNARENFQKEQEKLHNTKQNQFYKESKGDKLLKKLWDKNE
ncbi:MAG: hypothetical protein SOW25_07675 [Helicobacter sp.]|nr:hypothetical protein [Helicobacteraceae bacterium]MDY3114185.1 hypothetical protein [Helicobacter sp.]